jgi:hypothetical protein
MNLPTMMRDQIIQLCDLLTDSEYSILQMHGAAKKSPHHCPISSKSDFKGDVFADFSSNLVKYTPSQIYLDVFHSK